MLERVTMNALMNVLSIPILVWQLSGEHARSNIRVASFGSWRVLLDFHLVELFKVCLHKLIAISLQALTHTLILKTEVLDSKQAASK